MFFCQQSKVLDNITIRSLLDLESAFEMLQQYLTKEYDWKKKEKLHLLPFMLHDHMDLSDQHKVVSETHRGYRKVVLSTHIAEASVTLPGIVYVIDSGFTSVC